MKLDVWEYARLMVQLESNPQSDLFKAQQDGWAEIDAHLGSLADEDMNAYSDFMLNSQVDLGDLTIDQRLDGKEALEQAASEIQSLIQSETDKDFRDNLSLERKALLKSAKRLS